MHFQVSSGYGFQEQQLQRAQQSEVADDDSYDEIITSYTVGALAQIAYKTTKIAYFHTIFITSCAVCTVCLARKAFRDYTFFKYCELKCIYLAQKFPLLPLVLTIAAAHTMRSVPLLSMTMALSNGMILGFNLRVKWLSALMHWQTK